MKGEIGQYNRIGLFTYKRLNENEYEFLLEIPIKFTKKQQKEFNEYVVGIFGEDSQFKIIGESFVADKKFIVKKK